MTDRGRQNTRAKLEQIGELISGRHGDDYESLRGRLRQARELFHEILAERFTGSFNAKIATASHTTYTEKLDLARASNADLRLLGLAVRCPKTGAAAVLHATLMGSDGQGRLQVELIDSDPARRRTVSAADFPTVELIGFPDRGGPHRVRRGRKLPGRGMG